MTYDPNTDVLYTDRFDEDVLWIQTLGDPPKSTLLKTEDYHIVNLGNTLGEVLDRMRKGLGMTKEEAATTEIHWVGNFTGFKIPKYVPNPNYLLEKQDYMDRLIQERDLLNDRLTYINNILEKNP